MSQPAGEGAPSPASEERTSRLLLAAIVLVWLGLSLPLLSGQSTLFERDVFSIHLHQKHFGAQELQAGSVPYFRPDWGLGQTFRSNPNVLPLYPGNLLYLVLPFWTAFNLHYLLHWLIAFFAMGALARVLGATPLASLMAAISLRRQRLSPQLADLLQPAHCGRVVAAGHRGSADWGSPRDRNCRRCMWSFDLRWRTVHSVDRHDPTPDHCRTARRMGHGHRTLGSRRSPRSPACRHPRSWRSFARSASRRARPLGAADTSLFVFHPLRLLELLIPQPFGQSSETGADRFLLGDSASRSRSSTQSTLASWHCR